MKIKSKSFGPVYVKMDPDGNLEFGEYVEKISQDPPDISSPAVSLLYSLGSCIALSLQIVAKSKKVKLQPFHVKVSSEKATNLPSRFGAFTISISNDLIEDRLQAQQILEKAKSICTVSNTLNADINVVLMDESFVVSTAI